MANIKIKGDLNTWQGMYLVSAIIGILLQAYFLQYMVSLMRMPCKCSMSWESIYIFGYVVLMLIYECVVGYFLITQGLGKVFTFIRPFSHIIILLTIIFVIVTFMYVKRLEREKCDCSKGAARDLLKLVAKIYTLMFALLITYVLIMWVVYSLR